VRIFIFVRKNKLVVYYGILIFAKTMAIAVNIADFDENTAEITAK
jgi:hypothetical protein